MSTINLLEKAVLLTINIHSMGVIRKIDNTKVDLKDRINGTSPDQKSVTVDAKILKSKEYDDIKKMDRDIRKYLDTVALPSPLHDGAYFLPFGIVERAIEKLSNYSGTRIDKVKSFLLNAYQNAIDDARLRLNGFFDPSKYPTAEEVEKLFYVEYQFLDLNTPAALNEINPELYLREKEVTRKKLEEAAEEIKMALRETMQELVNHFVEILTPKADGQYRRFHESTLQNMQEFLANFKMRNIMEDTELDAIVEQAREILDGANVNTLRDSASFKKNIRKALVDVRESLETVVQTKGRKFDFSDEN